MEKEVLDLLVGVHQEEEVEQGDVAQVGSGEEPLNKQLASA